jgi:inorganic triphosphatase YgiF
MTAPGSAEIELKLGLAPAAMSTLLRHPAVVAARRGPLRRIRVVSTYFDTPDRALARAGIALRVRRDGRRWLQTVKGPALPGAGGTLHVRREDEWPLAGPALDAARFAETPCRKALERAWRSGTLAARFTTDFVRRTLPLELADGSFALLCIDHGHIRAGRRRVPIAEIELELEAGVPAALIAFARTLAADLPVVVGLANKAERGDALARRQPALGAPVRASALPAGAFPARLDAATALARVAANCVEQIAGNAAGLVAATDPEWVHQLRVGTRRLRACLALAARVGTDPRIGALAAEAKALAGALGPARDLDVFREETLPPLAAALRDDATLAPAFDRLRRRLERRRREARAAARAAVASKRFVEFVLAVEAWVVDPTPPVVPAPGGAATASARGGKLEGRAGESGTQATEPSAVARAVPDARNFAAAMLERRHRRVAKALKGLAGRSTAERHAERIAAKKLRYAAEFFGPMYPPAAARRYARELAALQAALGATNDAAMAARLAPELAGDDPLVQGMIRGYAAAREVEAAGALDATARRFARCARFWRRA